MTVSRIRAELHRYENVTLIDMVPGAVYKRMQLTEREARFVGFRWSGEGRKL